MKYHVAAVITSTALLFCGAVQAMPIPQYDQMAPNDKGDYEFFLYQGTMNLLKSQGDTALADKMRILFTPDEKNQSPIIDQLKVDLQKK